MNESLTWLVIGAIVVCLLVLVGMLQKVEGFQTTPIEFSLDTIVPSEGRLGPQVPPATSDGKDILQLLQRKTSAPSVPTSPSVPSTTSTSNTLPPIASILPQLTSTPSVSSTRSVPIAGAPAGSNTIQSSPGSANITSPVNSPAEQQGQAVRVMSPEPKIIVVPMQSTPVPPSCSRCSRNPCDCRRKCEECPRKPKPASCRPPKWEPGMPVPDYCPSMPDMSEYIRKDSIPCWACKL